jgi:hypothetical protein
MSAEESAVWNPGLVIRARKWMRVALSPGRGRQPRRVQVCCLAIFALALSVRLIHWQDNRVDFARGSSALLLMSPLYRYQEHKSLKHGGLLFPRFPRGNPDETILVHPPGYPALMALSDRVAEITKSQSDNWLRAIQIVVDALACALVLLIGAEVLPFPAAVIGGALASISPHLAYYSLITAPDSLTALPILIAIYMLIRWPSQPGIMRAVCSGAMIGMACWLRSNALLLAPFLGIIVLIPAGRRSRLKSVPAMIAAMALVILPITCRNWVVFHHFVPDSIGAGITLIEGIADYDEKGIFDLPSNDDEAVLTDVEWSGKAEYRQSLWVPDGTERDRMRFARGVAVIRSSPEWFVRVMIKRMMYMLRYNDFDYQETTGPTVAPSIHAKPLYGHSIAIPDGARPVWTGSPADLAASGTVTGPHANASLTHDGSALQVACGGPRDSSQYKSEPIAVSEHTDYILLIQINGVGNDVFAAVSTEDPRVDLASVYLKGENAAGKSTGGNAGEHSARTDAEENKAVPISFASEGYQTIRLSIYNATTEGETRIKLGGACLYKIGPTPNRWTELPRALIRMFQKYLFRTRTMRLLIALGIALLGLAGLKRELLLLLAVPAYYLCFQSLLHTEYRYILVIHYFLFLLAATTIYFIASVIALAVSRNAKSW